MRRFFLRAFVVLAIVLVVASFSISCGRTLTITATDGTPIVNAFVAYHYLSTSLGIADSVTLETGPITLLKTDSNGHVQIPAKVHLRWPLIQSGPAIEVSLVYAPVQHNALAWINRSVAVSQPQEFEVSPDLSGVRIFDVSGNPEKWESTLGNLSSLISSLVSKRMRGEPVPPLTDELFGQFKQEYAAMIERYGDSPRALPALPVALRSASDQEKREWQAMVEKDLAARPRWKDELERAFGTQVRVFGRP